MHKPLIVAELSANHNQSFQVAKESILAAKSCGADAIKLQTYTADCLTLDCKNEYFQIKSGTLWDGKTLYELYTQAYTPWEWHAELFDLARKIGLEIFSSPFSLKALELLESLDCPMYKIASFEIVDIDLIYEVAKTQKPIIISTGIATHEEIIEALEACHNAGNHDITLLKCTSSYPAKLQDANLLAMPLLGQRYGVKFGLSDHTQGWICPMIATSLGATMIEKHFILDRAIGGADCAFSLDKDEFAQMVAHVRLAITALGEENPPIDEHKLKNQRKFARSLFVSKDIKAGEALTIENIRSVRPNNGIAPKYLSKVLGKKARKNLEAGKPLGFDDFI